MDVILGHVGKMLEPEPFVDIQGIIPCYFVGKFEDIHIVPPWDTVPISVFIGADLMPSKFPFSKDLNP